MFDKFMKLIVASVVLVIMLALTSALAGGVFCIAWNHIAPSLFHLPVLTFTQGWALNYVVCSVFQTLKLKETEV